MKPFLILQSRPEKETADAEYGAICRYAGLSENQTERVVAPFGDTPSDPTLSQYAGVIAGGGPYNSLDSGTERTRLPGRDACDAVFDAVFTHILAKHIPTLGICYSLGFLSHTCGVSMAKEPKHAEFGTVQVHLTEEGMRDPLLRGVPNTFTSFSGHKESCLTLPEGAVLLAKNGACPVQMYRLGEHIYATQFHPELDNENMMLFTKHYKHHGYFSPEEAEQYIATFRHTHITEPMKILRNFVERYRET
jgi:GMP synthase (glutamine-hydrolysing)